MDKSEEVLDGTLTRAQRIEVAQDVIARFKSKQRKITLASTYINVEEFKPSEQFKGC